MHIVTGFDGFRGHHINPSAEFGRRVAAVAGATYVHVPVTYDGCLAAVRTVVAQHLGAAGQPESVLMLGRAAGEPGLRLERYGRRAITSKHPDNNGQIGGQLPDVPPQVEDCLETTCDLDAHLADCRQLVPGLSAHISDNAGGYVCNSLYYSVMATYPQARCLFVHLDGLHHFHQADETIPMEASTGGANTTGPGANTTERSDDGAIVETNPDGQASLEDLMAGLIVVAKNIQR